MKIQFVHKGITYIADLSAPLDISIPIKDGDQNPNCYYSRDVRFEVIRSGDFLGDTRQGGAVNHKEVLITPHGNGTHTECFGHITSADNGTINHCLREFHFIAQLVTVEPQKLENGDQVITINDLKKMPDHGTEALIVRTLPNDTGKLIRNYSGTNPPYFDPEVTEFLRKKDVRHLLTDLPSVDREEDGGAVKAHHNFWGLPNQLSETSTITELIYARDTIEDGLYLLNLQIISLELDVSPSKPVLFKLIRV